LISGLLGTDIKQIVNTFSWKTPNCRDTVFGLHQDSRFRRPKEAFRQLSTSYIQTLLAIDPHTPESGCLCLFPKSHLKGPLELPADCSVMDMDFDTTVLKRVGIDSGRMVEVNLDPGDVVMWLPDLVHGSRANRANTFRRAFINGYVKAANSDRGEWAFRSGEPCKLGQPRLVQYDDIHTRPEPHYVDGPLYPYK
jgi:ectoine hydroxylase-related dioxygenase (phytanoyl-CoA dioxygenase family)